MAAGRRVVLTREAQGNAPWLARLAELGLPALDLPLLRYETLDPPAPAGVWDWALVTSPQAARSLAAWSRMPAGVRLGALADGTRAALEAVGLHDELGCNVPDGAALAQAFLASVTAPCRVLLPGAASRLSEPGRSLRAAGYEVLEVALYRTSAVPPEQLPPAPLAAGDVIFFCSPTAVRAFVAAWQERPDCVAIGATTAAVAREAGFAPEVAETPDLDAMLRAAGLDHRRM